jgi:5-methylcytosine-specific restriction enzyme A
MPLRLTKPPIHRDPRIEAARREQRREYNHRRGSASKQGYGQRWRKLAKWFKSKNPLCADPFGVHDNLPVPGTEVDHIIPRSRGGTDDESNLQCLCASCHSRKTAAEDCGFGNRREGVGRLKSWEVNARERVGSVPVLPPGFDIGGYPPKEFENHGKTWTQARANGGAEAAWNGAQGSDAS